MLDYETRRQLEEAWLCEMSMNRAQAIRQCRDFTDLFIIHLAKCFLFYKTQWYNHWLKECGNYCVKCDDIRVKPDAKRLKPEVFMRDGCICEEWETAKDIITVLDRAIIKCPEVAREDATDEEAIKFLNLWNSLRVELANCFSNEDTFDRSDYMKIIDSAINKNI